MSNEKEMSSHHENQISRRDFVLSTTMLAGGFILSPVIGSASIIKDDGTQSLFWYQQPLRIMHTVLREADARDYDAAAVIGYMKKTGCNTLCVNAGGIVDFFRNPLPAANVNRYMGDRDILREISNACKAEGFKLIARIDFRGAEEHVYKKFPGWFKKGADGKATTTNYTRPALFESCYTGQYRNEYANQFVAHVMQHYAVDGIWHNAPGFNGICYCDRCQAAFKAFSGKRIPAANATVDDLDLYMAWKRKAADEYMDKIKKTVKSFGNDKAYTAEVFSIYGVSRNRIDNGVDLSNARKHFDILVSVAFLTENQEDIHYENLNYGSTIIKFLKSMVPEREAVVMYGGNGTSHRLVIDPPVDLKVWLWQILSAGGRFWNCYFSNVPTVTHDRRNAFNEAEAYQLVKANEALLMQHVPVASIGIYYSRSTRLSYMTNTDTKDQFGHSIRGMETVLMENHIPHNFILDDQVSYDRLKNYKLVILPDIRCMSDQEIALMKTYVEEGGAIIATFMTSLYDEHGKERENFGLSEIFGVNYTGRIENTKKDNYQYIFDKAHPLVEADSTSTELLFTAGHTALNKPLKNARIICTWVPTIHNQPPDKASVLGFPNEYPTVTEHAYGKGKVIYFANQPDVLSYEIGHPDPRNLLLRSIRHLAQPSIEVETDAPSSVNIGLTRSLLNRGQYIVSLVNTSSGPVRPIRELIPVHDITVQLTLEGKLMKGHQVLRSQGEAVVSSDGRQVKLRLSKLEDFCAVSIEMEQ